MVAKLPQLNKVSRIKCLEVKCDIVKHELRIETY